MFKSTQKLASGEFARTITRLGGRDNALTSPDTTQYFQRVAKEHLGTVMALEADRMVNLRLMEEEVRTERDVIQEERRSTVDANPVSVLSEQMVAALYQNHPYRRPSLGWAHEMSKLSLRTRRPSTGATMRPTTPSSSWQATSRPRKSESLRRRPTGATRATLPSPSAAGRKSPKRSRARRLHIEDARVASPILLRYYHVPSYAAAQPGQAESIELLTERRINNPSVNRPLPLHDARA